MEPREAVIIQQPNPIASYDPTVSLDRISRVFVVIGWLVIITGIVVGVVLSAKLELAGFVMGLGIALSGGSWLFFGYAGQALARIAVCAEITALDTKRRGTGA